MAERKSFLLRIDPELWAGLEAWAADELRSVNGQIEYLLKQALAKPTNVRGSSNFAKLSTAWRRFSGSPDLSRCRMSHNIRLAILTLISAPVT